VLKKHVVPEGETRKAKGLCSRVLAIRGAEAFPYAALPVIHCTIRGVVFDGIVAVTSDPGTGHKGQRHAGYLATKASSPGMLRGYRREAGLVGVYLAGAAIRSRRIGDPTADGGEIPPEAYPRVVARERRVRCSGIL
jgi:hypothetical protein